MKSILQLLIIILYTTSTTLAFDLFSSKYYSEDIELKPFVDFTKKDVRCSSLAIVQWPRPTSPIANMVKEKTRLITCVGDISIEPGTIREVKGCSAFFVDGFTGQIRPLERSYGFNIIKGVDCNKGGFEKLLSEQVIGQRKVIDQLLGEPDSYSMLFDEKILIYALDKKTKDWFVQEKKKREPISKATFEKAIKSGDLENNYATYPKTFSSGDQLITGPKK